MNRLFALVSRYPRVVLLAVLLAAGSVRLGDVAEVTLAGAPRRGSASFNNVI